MLLAYKGSEQRIKELTEENNALRQQMQTMFGEWRLEMDSANTQLQATAEQVFPFICWRKT